MIIIISGDISTADQSVDTAEQSFDTADRSVNTGDSIDIPNEAEEIPPFTAEERIKFARRYEEGYDLNDPRYKAWLAIEYPNELDNDESMYNHQLLCNDTEPNDSALVSNDCLDTPTFTVEQELKYATRFEEGYDLVDVHYEAW